MYYCTRRVSSDFTVHRAVWVQLGHLGRLASLEPMDLQDHRGHLAVMDEMETRVTQVPGGPLVLL